MARTNLTISEAEGHVMHIYIGTENCDTNGSGSRRKVSQLGSTDTFFWQHHRNTIFDAVDHLAICRDQGLGNFFANGRAGNRIDLAGGNGDVERIELMLAQRPNRSLADGAAQNIEETLVHGGLAGCAGAVESKYDTRFWTARP